MKDREEELKEAYIQLLEKRVAQLQAVVDANQTPSNNLNGTVKDTTRTDTVNDGTANSSTASNEKLSSERYRNILRKWDNATGSYNDSVLAETSSSKPPSKDVAYTFRRVFDPETGEKDAYSEVDIEDQELIALLRSKIDKYPGVNFDGDIVDIKAPFAPIVHNWDVLEALAKENPDSQKCKDLNNLLRRIKTSDELAGYFKIREANATAKVTTFDLLWTEFPPNTLVVAKPFMNKEQILQVCSPPMTFSQNLAPSVPMLVRGWDWDGQRMVKTYFMLKFENFHGTKPLNELPCYPLKYHRDENALRHSILNQADGFIKATIRCQRGSGQMFNYNGNAYADRKRILAEPDHDLDQEEREGSRVRSKDHDGQHPKIIPVKGEIISDSESFLQYGSSSYAIGDLNSVLIDDAPSKFDEALKENGASKENLEQHCQDFLMLPPRILGYATGEKVWGQFGLDQISSPAGKNPKKFEEDLVLDSRYKDLIEALVESHTASNDDRGTPIKDIVADKGKGLVLLLHGTYSPPGVGKTLTAETIAAKTGKPLFVVSVAEIGLNASQAEQNLEKLFKLATKWEAILLVDEADVFLETRGSFSNASRNALVSVLLRVLEYYRGIMILTTNRIKSIDVAVISRIHLAVQYTDLKPENVKQIFKYFLDQLGHALIKDRAEIDHYIDMIARNIGLNGRQIRNVVSGASAKARADQRKGEGDGRLSFQNLRDVCITTQDFQDQLKDHVRGQRTNNEAQVQR